MGHAFSTDSEGLGQRTMEATIGCMAELTKKGGGI